MNTLSRRTSVVDSNGRGGSVFDWDDVSSNWEQSDLDVSSINTKLVKKIRRQSRMSNFVNRIGIHIENIAQTT